MATTATSNLAPLQRPVDLKASKKAKPKGKPRVKRGGIGDALEQTLNKGRRLDGAKP